MADKKTAREIMEHVTHLREEHHAWAAKAPNDAIFYCAGHGYDTYCASWKAIEQWIGKPPKGVTRLAWVIYNSLKLSQFNDAELR